MTTTNIPQTFVDASTVYVSTVNAVRAEADHIATLNGSIAYWADAMAEALAARDGTALRRAHGMLSTRVAMVPSAIDAWSAAELAAIAADAAMDAAARDAANGDDYFGPCMWCGQDGAPYSLASGDIYAHAAPCPVSA